MKEIIIYYFLFPFFQNNKDKKYYPDSQEKLREDVKKWLFNQSLENRMKICTVENEFFGKILYQMIAYKAIDKSMLFRPKKIFFSNTEDNNENEQFSKNVINTNDYNYNEKIDDRMVYPTSNTNIKITKTNKSGKKTEAPILGFSQANLEGFKDEEILANNFGNCFQFQSYRKNFSFHESNNYQNDYYQRQKMLEICSEDLLNNIIFFSVHHRYFPDCFTLSPEFLLEKEKFENCFSNLGNTKYFCNFIQSDKIQGNSKSQKQYCYKMPDWFQNNTDNEDDLWYPVSKYAIAFFEQVIMIKYLLNKSDKKIKTFSLLDELALNRFFTDRKSAINYIKKNYNNENKINILQELEIEKCYNSIITNKEKMKYVHYFQQSINKINKEDKFKNSPYIISDILNNPYSNKCEEKFNKMKGIKKPKNTSKNPNSNMELTLEEMSTKIVDILKNNDIISFIDYFLFQNYNNLWKTEFFLQSEIFEKLSNLITEQNCKELIFDSKQSKSNKKHRKKNKKNHNNNTSTQTIQKEEEKNNKIQKEYEGIFKDEEEELYAPYYLRVNTEQKTLYLKLKGNYFFGNKEKDEIKQFISKEIILGIIIDNVFLTPLNSGLDFYKELNNDDSIKDDKKSDINEMDLIMDKQIKDENYKNENELNYKNNDVSKEEENEHIINDNNLNNNTIDNVIIDDNNNNNKEITINSSASKENFINNNDSLSLKLYNQSSEIDKQKVTSTSATNSNTNGNEIIINNNEENKKNEENNANSNANCININSNEIAINQKENSKSKKKKEKEQKFFLYDTVKKKKKKTNISQSNNSLVSNEFSIISIKEPNRRLSFFDKLHNDIIKYETKVVMILNHSMKFKDYCIKEIKRLIEETSTFSKDYVIDVYGSYATGLMIEASDIDIKIKLYKGNKADLNNFFEALCQKLENERKFDKINPISTASVPVIKLLLSSEKFVKGRDDLENSFKQYKDMSLFKNYIFDTSELTKIKIDVTFILVNGNKYTNNNDINEISEKNEKILIENNSNNLNNNEITGHDHDKSIGGEMSSVSYVKEQIVKYPEVKYILRVLKRYFYYKKMNTSFLGGLSSYNLFLLLLSYAKFLKLNSDANPEIIEKKNNTNNKSNTNLGFFLFNFLDFFKVLDFSQCIIDINSPNIYEIYDIIVPEKSKEFNFGKSMVIIDPLTGVNASKSSYKIEEIHNTFSEAFDFFYNEKIKYDKEGKTKISKNNNYNKDILIGLSISNKNDSNHGGGSSIIEKFLGK